MTSTHIEQPRLPEPRVEEVSPGVFAYIQLDGSWGLNNTGFIVGKESVVAIDSCFTEHRTRRLLDALRAQAGSRPVRTLINTHHHGDHTFGNHLFTGATIIGHELCRDAILREGVAAHRLFPQVEWGDIQLAPPTLTFRDSLDLWIDDLKVQLIYVGPAHTTNDVVAWLPERKTLFCGDVLFNGGTPFLLAGSLQGSLNALERVRGLGAERIVSGHGAIAGPAVIDDVAEYLALVREGAGKGFAARATPLDVARTLDLGRFGEWLDAERLAPNIHRAYSELRGEPLGTPLSGDAIADMITFNGGNPPRCLA